MNETTSRWQTERQATAYLEGIRGAVPGATLQLELIHRIIESWQPMAREILDIGCGDGILGRSLMERFPNSHVTFADFSEPMLVAAKGKLADSSRAVLCKADFSNPTWWDAVSRWSPFDVIVSGFAIHHQPDSRKQQLYAEIHEHLSPGGIFLNLEHVASVTPSCEKLFEEIFVDHLLRFQKSTNPDIKREEIETAFYNRPDKKENILASVNTQCAWLREIGFEDVDCFFKLCELALFGGRKNARQG